MTKETDSPVLACMIDAIPKAQRPLHQANAERLMASMQEIRAEASGYAWRLPNEPEMLQTIAAFISYERLCCPFFHFNLDVEPNQGPLWLSITGAMDVKEFLQGEGLVPPNLVPAFEEM
jgi:hypothetical protein